MGGPGVIDGESVTEIDNFLPSKFIVNGVEYYSAENYFQATKCLDKEEMERLRNGGTGEDVWKLGTSVKLRPDWEIVKVRVMYEGNKAKFEQNEALSKKLLSTKGPVTFSEGSPFWCAWNGKITELIREELKPEDQRNVDTITRIRNEMTQYEEEKKKEIKL